MFKVQGLGLGGVVWNEGFGVCVSGFEGFMDQGSGFGVRRLGARVSPSVGEQDSKQCSAYLLF